MITGVLNEYKNLNGDVRKANFSLHDDMAEIDLLLNDVWVADVTIERSLLDWAVESWLYYGCIRGNGYAVF